MCECFGHDIPDSQTCRYAAQYIWTTKFATAEANKSVFEANARKFAEINNKNIVCQLHASLQLSPTECTIADEFYDASKAKYNKLRGVDSE